MADNAMIVLASEQLWPNIHGIVHWSKHADNNAGLSELFIYYTDDEKRSARPARSLKVLCDKEFPAIRVHLAPHPMPITPEAVHDQIRRWQQEHPNRRWIINATGGLKLMFAGITDLVGIEDTQVVYRELSGQWFQLTRQNGRIVSLPIDIPPNETDSIPILTLVEAHWLPAPGSRWTSVEPEPIDVLRLTDAAIRQPTWRAAFHELGLPCNEQDGFLFEKFLAAVLLELGVTNLKMNLQLTSALGEMQHEIDLVANYGGRLHLLDVKLQDKDDPRGAGNLTTQIRQAAEAKENLGGLGAKMLLVRPNRDFTPDQRELAEAQGVKVLDRSDKWELFDRLAGWLDISHLSKPLEEAQQRLRAVTIAPFWCAFEREPRVVEELEESPANDGGLLQHTVVDLDAYRLALEQDWFAYICDGVLHLQCKRPENVDRPSAEKLLIDFLSRYGSVTNLRFSNSGATCWCRLQLPSGQRLPLFNKLAAFRSRSLLGSLAASPAHDPG